MKFLKRVEIDMGSQWDLYQTTLTELVKRQVTFKINHSRQRKYLYSDKQGGVGHEWQRKVFTSLIMGVPFPNFEIHIVFCEWCIPPPFGKPQNFYLI